MLGHVAKIDRQAFAGGIDIDRIPAIVLDRGRFKACWSGVRHGPEKSVVGLAIREARDGCQKIDADELASVGKPLSGMLIEISDPPVSINDDHAIDRTLEYGSDAIRRVLGLLLCLQQLA